MTGAAGTFTVTVSPSRVPVAARKGVGTTASPGRSIQRPATIA
ncbi:hypothetical protein [Streptomyces hydrogenans]